jgi:dihydroorotase-like cyclic amidohydrolase
LQKLNRPGLHFPCSTEVLESAFGGFKALQGHHGRGTFTSLLAVFATQFDQCTPAKIRERFDRVSNKNVKDWQKSSGLTDSTQSRRTRAYAQARNSETAFSAA